MVKPAHIAIFLIMVCSAGCAGSVNVAPKDHRSLWPHSAIALSCANYDVLDIQRSLEYLLISRGLSVVTDRSAMTYVKMQNRLRNNAVSLSGGVAPGKTKGLRSIYVLRFSYHPYLTVGGSYIFTHFSARLVDLTTGEVVASAVFSQTKWGGKSISSVLAEFVNKLTDSDKFRPI